MSHLTDLMAAVAARYDDATVAFQVGKLKLNEHAQVRRIVLVRHSGVLKFSSGPLRAPKSALVAGVGQIERQVFAREELIECRLQAEDEDALDVMLDRFVNAAFDVLGPNCMTEENPYDWHEGDSSKAGAWESRAVALTFLLRVRLKSHTQTLPYIQLGTARAAVTELDNTVTLTPAVEP